MFEDTYDFRVIRGDTWEAPIWLEDPQGLEDLSGATARLQVRDAAKALILEASTANGRIQLPGPVVLAQDAPAGSRTLQVLPLPGPLLGNYQARQTLRFAGLPVRLAADAQEGDTALQIEPLAAPLNAGSQAPMGLVQIRIEASAMDLPPGEYAYDLEISWPGPPTTVETPLRGRLLVIEDISHV